MIVLAPAPPTMNHTGGRGGLMELNGWTSPQIAAFLRRQRTSYCHVFRAATLPRMCHFSLGEKSSEESGPAMPRIGSMFMVGALRNADLIVPLGGGSGARRRATRRCGCPCDAFDGQPRIVGDCWRGQRLLSLGVAAPQGLLPRQVVPEHAQKLHGTL